ncbi:MAG: S8 family serine peptidase, partial [Bacteroidota bacterium]
MAGDKRILVVLILLVQLPCWAQVNRYVIFFKDKQGTPFTISDPAAFLSPQAIERRIKQGIVVTEQDLPVNPSYVQGVAGAGADVFFRTRWFNGVLVQCDAALVPSIQNLSFVDRVEFVAPGVKLSNGGRKKTSLRKKNGTVGIETKSQLEMIGVHEMHQANVIGQNITIAVFDAGFPGVDATAPFSEIFAENRFNAAASYDFVYNTTDVFQYDGHGTEVLSVIAAKIPDDYTGGAYEANFQLYVTEDASSEYRVEEYNWAFAAERADSAGADIINSSLGYYDFDDASMNYTTAQMDGQTAVVTKAAQWSAERGIVVVCSAGNEGNIPSWRIITAPADAVDVLA